MSNCSTRTKIRLLLTMALVIHWKPCPELSHPCRVVKAFNKSEDSAAPKYDSQYSLRALLSRNILSLPRCQSVQQERIFDLSQKLFLSIIERPVQNNLIRIESNDTKFRDGFHLCCQPVPTTQTSRSLAWQRRHHQSAPSHNPKTGTRSQSVPTTQTSGRSARQGQHHQSAQSHNPKTGTLTYPCTTSGRITHMASPPTIQLLCPEVAISFSLAQTSEFLKWWDSWPKIQQHPCWGYGLPWKGAHTTYPKRSHSLRALSQYIISSHPPW